MTAKKKKGILPRTLREQIDAIAMAICLAVGLKYFLVEAYEIPTPSMQPTLMGSNASGVHDRILVNKAAWLLRKPQRFDIAVFHYPHNRSQNYVKRIWGLGGEHLSIIGGNVYRIHDGDTRALDRYECLAKPAGIQEGLWRKVYEGHGGEAAKQQWILPNSTGRWTFGKEGLRVQDTGLGARAEFAPGEDKRGDLLENIYHHGYPASIVEQIKHEAPELERGYHKVGDLRWTLQIQPDQKTSKIEILEKETYALDRSRNHVLHRTYRLIVDRQIDDKAKARLEIVEKTSRGSQEKVSARAAIEGLTLPVDRSFELVFTHQDGRFAASVAGKTLQTLAVPWKGRPLPVAQVHLQMVVQGATELRVLQNRLERDIYYTNNRDHPEYQSEVRVPKGHCWMLGDNTQNSADGRAWRIATVRVSDDGKLLELNSKEGRLVSGNLRFHGMVAAWPPDPDENPVVVPEKGALVFTDLWGEEHVIHAGVHDFEALSKSQYDLFVPEEYVIGRAFATFWPAIPWGQFRVGWIR